MNHDFQPFPKIPRLNRPVTVTEKIDGTNAAVVVTEEGDVYAQSRKRIIVPGDDNFGFAAWTEARRGVLRAYLGPGRHFGEWFGKGIQRGYSLDERRFALFNTHRWGWLNKPDGREQQLDSDDLASISVTCVPVLGYLHSLTASDTLERILFDLRMSGSHAAPGYDNPEGVVLLHQQSRHIYKVLLDNDDAPKSLAS